MPTQCEVWWWSARGCWCTQVNGKRRPLAAGRKNKKLAQQKLRAIEQEQQLLAEVNGAVTVARLCEQFLEDACENLAPTTYQSNQYCCQKLVDIFADRDAHTIESPAVKKV